MKKLLLFTLLTAMLLAVSLCLAEGAPQVGDTVNGFTLTEIRPFDLIDAQVYRFEHDKTGAEVFYIANDDTNRAFTLTFRTWPIDDTGLPHVFEHATLSGSEKYPSKQLFFNLSYQTFNSYMNASTYGHMTIYPVASLSEAQLLKLADFYTDSCFHPMVMEDESIYREEAWRYRMNSPEDPLTIEGTVYSEMLGATNLDRQALINAYTAGFPGSTINFSHGGNPDHIPEMTWDSLKAYHDAFYQPSNCVAYLYGELEDYGAFLALLDETFSQYEKTELVHEDAAYTPITEPVTAEYGFPTEAGSNDSHASTVYYMFICSDAEGEDELVLNTMTDLLVAGNSALSQSVQETLPYGSFACYIETTGPVPALMFTVSNVDPQDAETFKALVDEAIADVAANGFPATLVDSVLSSMEKDTLLIRGATCAMGYVALQIAKTVGCKVIAATQREEKFGFLEDADVVIPDDGRITGKVFGANKAIDLIGPKSLMDTLTAVEPGGIVCCTALIGGVYSIEDFNPLKDIPNGVYLTGFDSDNPTQKDVDNIFVFLDQNNLSPSVGAVYDFTNIREALMDLDSVKTNGKIVVMMEDFDWG